MRQTLFVLVACSILTGLSVNAAEPAIVLGQTAPFSGPSGQFGRQMWLGAQTYFDSINRQGGVNGRQIKVEALDDQYDPSLAQKNTATLLKDSNVFALFDFVGTPTILKALPELEAAHKAGSNIFVFGARSGAQQIREEPLSHLVFNIRPSYGEETEALVQHLASKGSKKIGIFIQDDSYGESGKAGVKAALEKRGLTIVSESRYKKGAAVSEAMTAQAKELKDKGVDAIVSIASYGAAAAFVRDARVLGYNGPIANISFVGSGDLLDLLQAEGRKAKKDFTQNLINSQVVPPVTDSKNALVTEYVSLSTKNPPQVPKSISMGETIRPLSFTGFEGYVNARAFVEILKKAKQPLTQKSFIEAASNFDADLGLGERFKLNANNHQALHHVYLTEVKDGHYASIQDSK